MSTISPPSPSLPGLCLVVVFLHLPVPALHRVAGLALHLVGGGGGGGGGGPAGVDVLPQLAVRAVLELSVLQEVLSPGLGQVTELP